MKIQRTVTRSLFLLCVLTVCLPTAGAAPQTTATGGPVVRKIDPPNWWVNYVPELTLLLTGENLSGAHVVSASKGMAVVGADPSSNGHYLFVRLKISFLAT